jgi:hypothetical protein
VEHYSITLAPELLILWPISTGADEYSKKSGLGSSIVRSIPPSNVDQTKQSSMLGMGFLLL